VVLFYLNVNRPLHLLKFYADSDEMLESEQFVNDQVFGYACLLVSAYASYVGRIRCMLMGNTLNEELCFDFGSRNGGIV
jgi:hypothetical protein